MTPPDGADNRERVEALFEGALDRSPAGRARFLDEACEDDPALLERVNELLRAHDRADGILDRESPATPIREPSLARRYGPYRVLHRLGKGGMGEVFLAVREDAFMRRVALKVMGKAATSEEALRRFDTERRILASLSHPNIAQLLDGGVSEEGVPYLAMEYVEGLSLTTYCDRERLTVDERLALFRKVCSAVHHAHQNLVVHRDLKPSNILVTPGGEPKLLDFGIAKLQQAASPDLVQPTTHPDFRALTPEYASPEQLRGDPITTATDVFSLGVLLYELLSGIHPFPTEDSGPLERMEAVCRRDADRPSDAVAARPASDPGWVARGTSRSELASRLRGDLDTIIQTALRKEPGRRYPSVEHLSLDIERHRSAEPVLAVGGSRRYRLGKFIRRHRLESAATAAVIGASALGMALTSWQADIARRERDRAALAREQAEASQAFVLDLFSTDDPLETLGDSVSARTLLERGLAQVDALDGDPGLRARLRALLARAYRNLGAYSRAVELYRAAAADLEAAGAPGVGTPSDPGRADLDEELADALRMVGEFREGLATNRQARRLLADTLGESHPRVSRSLIREGSILVYLARLAEADSVTRLALDRQRRALGDAHPSVTVAMESLALVSIRRGEVAEAESLLREVVDRRGPDGEADPLRRTLSKLRLARLLAGQTGRVPEAEAIFRQVLLELPSDHVDRPTTLSDLADAVASRGRLEEALDHYRQALDLRQARRSPDHPSVADVQYGLGRVAVKAGALREAELAFRDALRIWQLHLGPDHPSNAYGLLGLASLEVARGRLAEAEVLVRQALAVREATLVSDHPLIFIARASLGDVLGRRGRVQTAEALLVEARSALAADLGESHPQVREVEEYLGRLHGGRDEAPEAARFPSKPEGPPPG